MRQNKILFHVATLKLTSMNKISGNLTSIAGVTQITLIQNTAPTQPDTVDKHPSPNIHESNASVRSDQIFTMCDKNLCL
jgi:hypothetical protein